MYEQEILCGISKGTFEIPHKISYPYIERCDVYTTKLKFQELLDLRAHKCFWNAPLVTYMSGTGIQTVNSLAPGRYGSNFRIFEPTLGTDIWSTCFKTDLSWTPQTPLVMSHHWLG